MMTTLRLFSCFIVLYFFHSAHAQELSVEVPQSQIHFSKEMNTNATNNSMELQFSTWSPLHFSQPSQIEDTSSFSTSIPEVSLLFSTKFAQGSWYDLSAKYGFAYTRLQRSGNVSYDITQNRVSQNLNMYQGVLGVELASTHSLFKNIHPLVGLSLAPAWSQSVSSSFNNGVSELAWMAKASAGVSVNMKSVASLMGLPEAALEIGVEGTQSLGATNLSGAGFWAGTRLGWQ